LLGGNEADHYRARVGKEGLERVDDIQFGPNATSSCEKKVTRQPVILPNNLTFHDIKYWLGAMEQTIIGREWVTECNIIM
jgi:hypothetical protein